jgi:hypothetical protein
MAIHKKSKGNRLSRQHWLNIRQSLASGSKTIQEISDFYGISRNSIYAYGWRHGFIQKQKDIKQATLWEKILAISEIKRFARDERLRYGRN